MIHKRHLLTLDTKSGTERGGEKSAKSSKLSMGEDEQWEAASKNNLTPRTWWRQWKTMH